MHITSSELLIKPDKKHLATQYHTSLVPHLNQIPGFIREARYTSVNIPNKILLLSWWEDSSAIERWRNQSQHLRIQEKGSRDVFADYRLRIGPTYNADQHMTDSSMPPKRGILLLHWTQKSRAQMLDDETPWELKDKAVAKLKVNPLDDETYEDETSFLRLTGWISLKDALSYENVIVQNDGDRLERVFVERDYTKQRRVDAPHHTPGGQHCSS